MILVTGGTGFLGGHVVSALLERKEGVRVLARQPRADLKERGVEVAIGDVLEPGSLDPAFRGVKKVLHLAGRVDRSSKAADALYEVHVDGTRNVLRAAARAKVERFVHVSTSGTVAVSDTPDPIPDERSPDALPVVRAWPYYLSKIFAERLALEASSEGVRMEDGERRKVPVVVVSPSLLLGPGDDRLSSSMEIVRFLRREIAAVPRGGLNFVDVRDAAQAVLAALEKGKAGERYLVGGANMSVDAFFLLLEKVSGVGAPSYVLSRRAQDLAVKALSGIESVLGSESDEAVSIAMGGKFWYLDAAKARAELGFVARPAETTLREAVEWIRSLGPLPAPPGVMGRVLRAVRAPA